MDKLVDSINQKRSHYSLLQSNIPQSAGLAEALTKSDFRTFVQKYTSPVIHQILVPLAREIKGLL